MSDEGQPDHAEVLKRLCVREKRVLTSCNLICSPKKRADSMYIVAVVSSIQLLLKKLSHKFKLLGRANEQIILRRLR